MSSESKSPPGKRRVLASSVLRETVAHEPEVGGEPIRNELLVDLLDLFKLFRRYVTPSTRTYRLRTYPNVFVGSEAVDALLLSRIVTSRAEACEVGSRLFEAGAFFHVTRDHSFKDATLFYRYYADELALGGEAVAVLPPATATPAAAPSTPADVTPLQLNQVAGPTRAALASMVSPEMAASLYASSMSPGSDPARYRVDLCREASKVFASVPSRMCSVLAGQWRAFQACVELRNVRASMFRIEEGVFVGREVVSRMVACRLAPTRAAAVALGNELMQAGAFHHVTYKTGFEDRGQLYRSLVLGPCLDVHVATTETPSGGTNVVQTIASSARSLAEIDMRALERDFRAHMPRYAERRWLLRTYYNVFIGTEAVEFLFAWMREHGYDPSLAVAEGLGQQLFDARVFRHVTDDHPFHNDFLFYTLNGASGAATAGASTRLKFTCPIEGCTADTFTSMARMDGHLARYHNELPDGEVHLVAVHELRALNPAEPADGFARLEIDATTPMNLAVVTLVATGELIVRLEAALLTTGRFNANDVAMSRFQSIEVEFSTASPFTKTDLVATLVLRVMPSATRLVRHSSGELAMAEREPGGASLRVEADLSIARSPETLLQEILER